MPVNEEALKCEGHHRRSGKTRLGLLEYQNNNNPDLGAFCAILDVDPFLKIERMGETLDAARFSRRER
jgi:hypothetical protein